MCVAGSRTAAPRSWAPAAKKRGWSVTSFSDGSTWTSGRDETGDAGVTVTTTARWSRGSCADDGRHAPQGLWGTECAHVCRATGRRVGSGLQPRRLPSRPALPAAASEQCGQLAAVGTELLESFNLNCFRHATSQHGRGLLRTGQTLLTTSAPVVRHCSTCAAVSTGPPPP